MTTYRISSRATLDGWALQMRGATQPMPWTLSTTRREARAELRAMRRRGMCRGMLVDVVPVVMRLERVTARSTRGRSNRTRPLPMPTAREIA